MIFLLFLCLTQAFKSPFLRGVHKPINKEIQVKFPLVDKSNLFGKIDGFFGQIGPNPKYPCDSEYSLFDGDGMVHGIFFQNGTLTYVNHWVRTKKLLTEMKWKKKMYISLAELKGIRGLTSILSSEIMKGFKIIPSGYTANTAFMYTNKKLYALHETDTPYELKLNYTTQTIETGDHLVFPTIPTTTAHPKFDSFRKRLYLYSYTSLDKEKGQFLNNVFNYSFGLKEKNKVPLLNNGIIHDIGQSKNHLIIPDMPLKTDLNLIFQDKLPLFFDKNGTTRFGLLNKDTDKLTWITFKENFFIFHFSESFETRESVITHACLLEDVNFSSFIDNTKYKPFEGTQLSQIILHKNNGTYEIIRNKYLMEIMNNTNYITEFPLPSLLNKNDVYCGIVESKRGQIEGYAKFDLSNFENCIPEIYIMNNRNGNSEAQPIIIDNKEYLLTYTYDKKNYYLSLIDLEKKEIHDLKLPKKIRIPPGFHSIFIPNSQ